MKRKSAMRVTNVRRCATRGLLAALTLVTLQACSRYADRQLSTSPRAPMPDHMVHREWQIIQ